MANEPSGESNLSDDMPYPAGHELDGVSSPLPMTSGEKLELCPFCGKVPDKSFILEGHKMSGKHIQGVDCRTKGCVLYNRFIVLDEWNRRAPVPDAEQGAVTVFASLSGSEAIKKSPEKGSLGLLLSWKKSECFYIPVEVRRVEGQP